ncbi:MAG TPA: Type 1 glutamine amidotransferase-like domain-containing protein [Polyangiaceae bacterium]|nr:Type 1 glutamine amidotransferase-like domain-containing protein [Polyangiaceae bacterium]
MSEPKPTFLIAGDPRGRRAAMDPVLRSVFEHCGVRTPSIAYIGAASGDDRRFFTMVAGALANSGAANVTLAATVGHFERRSFEKACAVADAVFFSGGDVDAGMGVINRHRLAPFLSELYHGGKLLFGISAGSIMLARAWVRFRDGADSTGELFPCLGIADVLCDVHDEDEGWGELRALLKLSPASSIGYGIRAGSAICVKPDGTVEPMRSIDKWVSQGNLVIPG